MHQKVAIGIFIYLCWIHNTNKYKKIEEESRDGSKKKKKAIKQMEN